MKVSVDSLEVNVLTTVVCLLCVSGNLEKQTAKGSTALHYCCLTDNSECLKLLLRGRASVSIGKCPASIMSQMTRYSLYSPDASPIETHKLGLPSAVAVFKALHRSAWGVTTDLGLISGCVTAGRDRETHEAAYNLPSFVLVTGGFGRQGFPCPIML